MTNILFKKQFYKILRLKLNDPYLCYYILHNFIQNEKKEEENARAYHTERWETIAGNYFKCAKVLPLSYVVDGKDYHIFKDKDMGFYNETGISYQNRDLILSLINDYGWMSNKNFILPREISKDVDDQIYSVMAQKIHDKMISE